LSSRWLAGVSQIGFSLAEDIGHDPIVDANQESNYPDGFMQVLLLDVVAMER
jgi:hypothetical protein